VPGTAVLGQIDTTGGTELIVILRDLVSVCMGLLASLTWAVKLKVPAPVGVPLMTPLLAFSVKPTGREPLAIDQVYGMVPPVAASVAE
jgi:hypothetical protein